MIQYIIEFLLCSAVFIVLYKLLLEGRIAHVWARSYIVVTMFASLVIPALELPLYPAQTLYYDIPVFSAHNTEASADLSVAMPAEDTD